MADIAKDVQAQADKAGIMQREIEGRVRELKALQDGLDETWNTIKTVMIDNDIKSIKGDWGSITIAERQTFKGDVSEVAEEFLEKKISSKKVNAYYTLGGTLPDGIERNVTKYLTKRIK
jgi:inhibitor of KinA sporulation pathway (predicted exonuclease)